MKKVSLGLVALASVYSLSMLYFRATLADSLIVLFLGAIACTIFFLENKFNIKPEARKESDFDILQKQYELQKLQFQMEEHKIAMSRRFASQDANPDRKIIF